ncbi:MAG TPA: hypothetical protein VHB74_01910 [Devosia sp.]|nr:hypothetical protein [Devosia sp.]
MQTPRPSRASRHRARLDRQFDRIGRRFPAVKGFLDWARRPSSRLLRFPVALLLIAGGIFSFLPILGLWMLPLGLLLLAIDVPALQGPIGGALVRGERWWQLRRRRKRAPRAASADPSASA